MLELPNDALAIVASNLELQGLHAFSRLCRRTRQLVATEEVIWAGKTFDRVPISPTLSPPHPIQSRLSPYLLRLGPAPRARSADVCANIVILNAAVLTGICKRYGWALPPGTLSWRATAERHCRLLSALNSGCALATLVDLNSL